MNKRFYLAIAVIGGCGFVVTGCQRGGQTAARAAQQLATQVSVTPARTATISETAEVTGSLNALHDVTVGVKNSGKVVAVYAREGDMVRAGQVVAQQDTTDLQAQLDQQQANLASARTKLEQAKVAYQNAQTTLQWTRDQTASAVRQAQAALQAAQDQAAVVKQGARPQERQQAQETVAAAKAERDQARADLKRYEDLYRQQAISAQQLDQAQSVADSADARYNSAVQGLSLIQAGSRPEDIRRAQAAVEQANQALVAAQSNRDQVAMRRADVETARSGILAADAGVHQAEAAVQLAAQAIRDAAIRSPITGVVAERKVEPGMQLTTVKPDIMRIVALDSIFFDAQVSETQYAAIRAGQPVTVLVDALPGRTFRGVVSKIYPVASAARSFTVRISIRNEGNLLRPQMFARGRINLATHNNAIVVPHDAMLDYSGTGGRVFVAVSKPAGTVAEERRVRTGFETPRTIEILAGIQPGDRVITSGQAQIQDGDKIQVLPANTGPASTDGTQTSAALP
ncbi:MAG TPA: efflux RND transporter periplasmic adaptor subunit [Chthonomonadaceae bacterium]|nr:efflux RND transporter periplasmic adaptor subunit [Chthonomonadaceae bacterium]